MIPNGVENEIVTLSTFGEILLGVINDPICADGSDHVHIPRTAHAGHICAKRLGDLHSERTHTSSRTVNQDLLARLNLSLVAKTLQCGECRYRCRSRLLKRHVIWLDDQCGLGSTCILAKAPPHAPNTSSPGLNCVTFLPTASTWPATSRPGRAIVGLRSPNSMRRLYGLPFIKRQSSGLTEAARTFIKT